MTRQHTRARASAPRRAWQAPILALTIITGVTGAGGLPPAPGAGFTGAAPSASQALVRSAAAETARLDGLARAWVGANRIESLAVARAAIRAADGASQMMRTAGARASSRSSSGLEELLVPQARQVTEVDNRDVDHPVEPTTALASEVSTDIGPLSAARSELQAVIKNAARHPGRRPGDPSRGVTHVDLEVPSLSADFDLNRELARLAAEVFSLAAQLEEAAQPESGPSSSTTLRDLESAVRRAESQLAPDGAAAAASSGAAEGVLARAAAAADSWPNGAIPLSELCLPTIAPTIYLRCDAAAALDQLAAAYRAGTGRDLQVTSGYRSAERQTEIKRLHGGRAAAPGRSNHGRGIAVDLAEMGGFGEFDAPGYLWMKAHARAFGWYHPPMMEPGGGGPQEPWHWEFGTWTGYDDRSDRRPPRGTDTTSRPPAPLALREHAAARHRVADDPQPPAPLAQSEPAVVMPPDLPHTPPAPATDQGPPIEQTPPQSVNSPTQQTPDPPADQPTQHTPAPPADQPTDVTCSADDDASLGQTCTAAEGCSLELARPDGDRCPSAACSPCGEEAVLDRLGVSGDAGSMDGERTQVLGGVPSNTLTSAEVPSVGAPVNDEWSAVGLAGSKDSA